MNYFENMKNLSIKSKLFKMNEERQELIQELASLLKVFDEKYFKEGKIDREKIIADLKAKDTSLLKELNDNRLFKDQFGKGEEESGTINTESLIQTIQADEYWTNYFS